MIPRWLLWPLFAAAMGFAIGGSFARGILYAEPMTDNRPTKQKEDTASAQAKTAQQGRGTDNSPTAIPQIPSDDLKAEKAANNARARHEPEKGWFQNVWTDPNATFAGAVALFTLALVIVGAWQARRLRQTVEATEKASAETRRIGEAQIRAYVNISSAEIYFVGLGMLSTQAHPMVKIIATNTGQSPARNFIWNPTVQYFSSGIGTVSRSLTRELGSNWCDILGVGIAVGQSHPDAAMVPEMELLKFLGESNGDKGMVLVRLRIQFEFEDVFDKRNIGEAYFAGMLKRMEGKILQTPWGETQWSGKLNRLHRPNDWPT
ncbi:MAG TPA: hypothetical protein VHX86_03475 [Tepidisphaeraceae bacterium]|jgi:hypothetical protein|nr:hypothetical protein [Tepidisphaeraceae bacterium]